MEFIQRETVELISLGKREIMFLNSLIPTFPSPSSTHQATSCKILDATFAPTLLLICLQSCAVKIVTGTFDKECVNRENPLLNEYLEAWCSFDLIYFRFT